MSDLLYFVEMVYHIYHTVASSLRSKCASRRQQGHEDSKTLLQEIIQFLTGGAR